jgi:hypothetical protein
MWVCESMKPGTTRRPFASTTRVFGPRSFWISAVARPRRSGRRAPRSPRPRGGRIARPDFFRTGRTRSAGSGAAAEGHREQKGRPPPRSCRRETPSFSESVPGGGQARDGGPVGRAGRHSRARAVEELDGPRIAAVLSADPDLQLRIGLPPRCVAIATSFPRRPRRGWRKDPRGEFPSRCTPEGTWPRRLASSESHLRQVVGAEGEEVGRLGDLLRPQGRARESRSSCRPCRRLLRVSSMTRLATSSTMTFSLSNSALVPMSGIIPRAAAVCCRSGSTRRPASKIAWDLRLVDLRDA